MIISNIHEAKTNLSQLIKAAEAGKDVIIAKAGKPVAKLTKYQPQKTKRQPGFWQNKITIAQDFDTEDAEINNLFYGQN